MLPEDWSEELESPEPTEDYEKAGTKAWRQYAHHLKIQDEKLVGAWKDEIDTLLVFAGLFSGVLTAFNVQSYQLLQPTASPNTTVQLLAQISAQLGNLSANPAALITSQFSAFPETSLLPSSVPSSAIVLNCLWFSSLVISLSAASICIVVKQWLNQYSTGLPGGSRAVARTRQFRYVGLKKWRVKIVLMLLPVLLLGSLTLFLAGLLVLLWTLHRTVAIVATVMASLLGAFQITTTVLPAFIPDCSYQSPQSLLIFILVEFMKDLMRKSCKWLRDELQRISESSDSRVVHNLYERLSEWRFVTRMRFYTWRHRERRSVDAAATELDRSLLADVADMTRADELLLRNIISPCILSLEPAKEAVRCFWSLHTKFSSQKMLWNFAVDSSIPEVVIALALNLVARLEEELPEAHIINLLRAAVFWLGKDPIPVQMLQRWHDILISLLRNDDCTSRLRKFVTEILVTHKIPFDDEFGSLGTLPHVQLYSVEGDYFDFLAGVGIAGKTYGGVPPARDRSSRIYTDHVSTLADLAIICKGISQRYPSATFSRPLSDEVTKLVGCISLTSSRAYPVTPELISALVNMFNLISGRLLWADSSQGFDTSEERAILQRAEMLLVTLRESLFKPQDSD